MIAIPRYPRAISWSELTAGRWTADYTQRPCESGLLAVGRRWPSWRTGTPPTWAEFVGAREIDAADRRWLVARVLLRDRRRLVAWSVDCAESVVDRAGEYAGKTRTEAIAPLRRWIAGEAVDLKAVRDVAWSIRYSAAYASASAAASAYASAAAYASAYASASAYAASASAYAADAAAYAAEAAAADHMMALALPHLAAVCEVVS